MRKRRALEEIRITAALSTATALTGGLHLRLRDEAIAIGVHKAEGPLWTTELVLRDLAIAIGVGVREGTHTAASLTALGLRRRSGQKTEGDHHREEG